MKRREFLKRITAAAGAVALGGCGSPARRLGRKINNRPNVVIILTDDQGYADVGCYGAQGLTTPNLDKMAAEGTRFTDFHVAAPVCTPSRAALMTGCYPQRVSLPHVLGPDARTGISGEEVTIAEILKSSGYATACFGKWHLGHHPRFLPCRHGFDEYFGLPYSNDMQPTNLIDGEQIVDTSPDQTQLTLLYTSRAVSFIERNKHNPFFIYLPHSMPHVPLHVSARFMGKSSQGLYGDVIMEIDWSVGEILSALRRLGLDEKTLIIFTSDNGPWLSYGDHAGSAGPLREGKTTTFEGGMRIPCIMRMPGTIAPGSVCTELATAMDFLPTVARMAAAPLPPNKIDGHDIGTLLTGAPNAKSPYTEFFHYSGWRLDAVRSGRWKLHRPHTYNTLAGRPAGIGGEPARYQQHKIPAALFDLTNDISEQHDVSAEHRDVAKRLSGMLARMRDELGDDSPRVQGRAVRPPGRV